MTKHIYIVNDCYEQDSEETEYFSTEKKALTYFKIKATEILTNEYNLNSKKHIGKTLKESIELACVKKELLYSPKLEDSDPLYCPYLYIEEVELK